MSLQPPRVGQPLPVEAIRRCGPLYWVIGGCWGDAACSWRRWSEVYGPYGDRAPAEGLRRRIALIHADDPRVHFEVVRLDDGHES